MTGSLDRGPLDVAVNLLWIAPGRVGGSEEYLVRQLSGIEAGDRVSTTLFCSAPFAAQNAELVGRHPTQIAPLRRDHRGARIGLEHTWLARRSRRADVIHHGGGTAPMVGPRPIVLTVHDLQYLTFPEYFGRARRTYLEFMMPRSVARAAIVTTPSQFVKSTVVEAFGIADERVIVVPHGIPDVVRPDPDRIAAAVERVGLRGRPYVIYPAITHPHKGHREMIEMLDHLAPDLHLVLIGGTGAAEGDLAAAISRSPHGARVIRPGRVSSADRDALVAGAEAMVFPSEYEGFGAPLVEAMALGTPVVCSDAPAIEEVVADAAVVVSERTGAGWAKAVETAIARRDELVVAGAARRQAFTLRRSALALVGAYRSAVET